MLFYSAALAVGLLLSSPWWLFRMATTQRYREGLGERMGRVPARLRAAVQGRRVIWVHAVSVGEVLAASRLVDELGVALGSGWIVVVSTTTRTGQALAHERLGAGRVFYFPLDFAWAVRAWLHALRPAALLLMESELWPRMLHECNGAGVPVAVINARVSDRSFTRGLRVRGIWKHMLRKVSLWLAQSEEDARRLLAMGAREDAVQVAGNLKYDVRAPKQSRIAELIHEAANGRPVIVAGSTHRLGGITEEEILLTGMQNIWKEFPRALLVVAPRHPERFDEVERLASTFGKVVRATRVLQADTSSHVDGNIVLLDTVGDLAAVYGAASVAFIGGSLVRRGGHNPLEAAQFGVPVLMGPHRENFRDISAKMQECHALIRVDGELEFEEAVRDLLAGGEWMAGTGERGRQVFEQQQGATARAVEAVLQLIREAGAGL